MVETDHKNLTFLKTAKSAKVRRWKLALQEFDLEYKHIKGEDNVVAAAFSRLCDHHPMDGEANTGTLTAFLMAGSSIGSNAPTYEPWSNSNSKKPITTEPTINPNLRTKIEAVHNSVSGHFGVEYTRKVLLDRGVDDDGLRRAVPSLCVTALCVSWDRSWTDRLKLSALPQLHTPPWKSSTLTR